VTGGDPWLGDLPRDISLAEKRVGAKEREWQSWDVVWTDNSPGTAPNPDIGNGTLTGRYRMLDARTMAFQLFLLWGSTTSPGSSLWRFSLPPAFLQSGLTGQAGTGWAEDSSNNERWPVSPHIDNNRIERIAASGGVTLLGILVLVPSNGVSPGVPFTWAAGDILVLGGIIETGV